MAIPLTVIKCD